MSTPPATRVLHVIESTTAGVRRYVTYLLQHQSSQWHMEVACPAIRQEHFGDTAFVDEIRQLGVRVHDVPMQRSIGPVDLKAACVLRTVVQRGKYDLIHTHSSKAGFLGRSIARLSGVPVVHTPNGLYYLGQRGVKRWFYQTLERLAGRLTTQLIAVSDGERIVIMRDRLVPPDRLCVIENGVDALQIRDEAAAPHVRQLCEQLGLNGQQPIIGTAGRMVPQKDPLTFVRAAAQLRQTYPTAQFVWCGDGELRTATEQLAAHLNVPLITTGHQENSAAIMQTFDVFVLPSIYEGLPFALLEAMALGIPIVASDISGVRDVLGDQQAGWLTEPRNETALATTIERALSQTSESQRRTHAAQHLVETQYSVQLMVQRHLELYQHLVQSKNSRSA
jgi:glycosyltransferase involved in cell wall biosynthesis